ncbi:hypothetical protein HK104_008938 [Borealophlyctis nickersoniae]|nr:hypothetical protein HK104_008938 [Borealophlyctis nickersoniae]
MTNTTATRAHPYSAKATQPTAKTTPPPAYAKERAVAIEAVIRASKLCQGVFKNLVAGGTHTKNDKSPVTVADFGAQAVVNSLLRSEFPDDPIVGEEDSKDLQANEKMRGLVVDLANSVLDTPLSTEQVLEAIDYGMYEGGAKGRFWTLDPIDGTKGFIRGEQFAVCLALVENGQVKLGVLGCPNLPVTLSEPEGARGSLFVAVRGQGAFQRTYESDLETSVTVSSKTSTPDMVFCESVEAGHSSQGEAAQIAKLLGMTGPSVRMDSQCKYGVLSRGDADIYLRLPVSDTYQEKIWDHAGGCLLVQEAGGTVTDVSGKPLDFSLGRTLKGNKGVVASNGKVHDQVMEAVKKVLAEKTKGKM